MKVLVIPSPTPELRKAVARHLVAPPADIAHEGETLRFPIRALEQDRATLERVAARVLDGFADEAMAILRRHGVLDELQR